MIVVVGSVNRDLVVRVARFPERGETVVGSSFAEVAGGKGANQAVAAARLGAAVHLVGRIGADAAGRALRAELEADRVDASAVVVDDEAPTGVALITVDDSGENSIVVVPGANGRVCAEDVAAASGLVAAARVLLLQFEIPMPAVLAAAAGASGTVVVNPAPFAPIPEELLARTDVLVVNETEAAAIGDPAAIGVPAVVVTQGAGGAVLHRDGATGSFPAFAVDVVDTTGAGDAFCGALAAAVDGGAAIEMAVARAVAAGSLATTAAGARAAMPDRAALDAFLGRVGPGTRHR